MMDATMQQGEDCLQDDLGFGSFRTIEQAPQEPRPKPAPPENLSADNTNRKMLDMPPVVGSMIHYSNKHLKYRPMPDDIDQVRDKLFRLEQDVLLDSQQIADYWPHMGSVWQRSSKATEEENGAVLEMWECRIRRRVFLKDKVKKSTAERQRANKDDVLGDAEVCKLRIRIVSYTKHAGDLSEPCGSVGFMSCKCIPEWAHFSRTIISKNANHQHSHDIEMTDRFKRADAIMYFAKLKVEEGYSYSSVQKWIQNKYSHVSTQVKHLTKQDVATVSRRWRMLNKDADLRKDIEDETDWERRRRECLDDIETTSQKRLAKALSEVCKRMPEAIDIAIPFLEKHTGEAEQASAIVEGDNIAVPAPGIPPRRDQKIANLFVPTAATLQPPRSLPPPPPRPQPPPPPRPQPPPPPPILQHIHYTANAAPDGRPLQSAPQSNGPVQAPSAIAASHPVPRGQPITALNSGTASQALINTPTTSHFVTPYTAAKTPTLSRNMPSPASSWPPLSVPHIVAKSNQRVPPEVNGAPANAWRPAWAAPATKRPANLPPADNSPPRKRTLVDEIAKQLHSELHSSG